MKRFPDNLESSPPSSSYVHMCPVCGHNVHGCDRRFIYSPGLRRVVAMLHEECWPAWDAETFKPAWARESSNIVSALFPSSSDESERWTWKMNYCQKKGMAPSSTEAWDAAEVAWVEANRASLGLLCPLESRVAKTLSAAGIAFRHEQSPGGTPGHLDFYLTDSGVSIEVKGGSTPRIAEQLRRLPNVVVLQGPQAVELFCSMVEKAHIDSAL